MTRLFALFRLVTCGILPVAVASLPLGASDKSETRRKWATPNEIRALSYAIDLAEMPMSRSKVDSDLCGELASVFLYGTGGTDGTYEYLAITNPEADKPYYGIALEYDGDKKRSCDTPQIRSVRLFYCNEYNMKFYDPGPIPNSIKDDSRATMKRVGKTPWQMGVFFAGMTVPPPMFYSTKNAPGRKYPIPLVDAEADSVLYPKNTKVHEPKKVAKHEVLYPLELNRSAISGKVTLYVKVNEAGCPVRIAVKESSQEVFERYAIAHVLQTTWEPVSKNDDLQEPWFETNIVFDTRKETGL